MENRGKMGRRKKEKGKWNEEEGNAEQTRISNAEQQEQQPQPQQQQHDFGSKETSHLIIILIL